MTESLHRFKLMSIVGARPNFMKVASLACAVDRHNREGRKPALDHVIVHTGQHYDEAMSRSFFRELEIPEPHYNLGVGSGSHAVQTAHIMTRFEPVLLAERPDALLVVGDVNSTVACALVAAKTEYNGNGTRHRPLVAHVEAGLRSRDRSMPEEINRILTDSLSDLLFATEQEALENLEYEGVAKRKIHFVGNVMIDTLVRHREKARKLHTLDAVQAACTPDLVGRMRPDGAARPRYGLVTLHRPSNVDSPETLAPIMACLGAIAEKLPLVFPVHPRTRKKLTEFGLLDQYKGIVFTEPLGYLEFLNLLLDAGLILTDSGGIQEEATFLQVPCITLRNNTERPVTVTLGTNHLTGVIPRAILEAADGVLSGNGKKGGIPPLWDGEAGARVIEIIAGHLGRQ